MSVTIANATVSSPVDANVDASQVWGQTFEVVNTSKLKNITLDFKTNGTPSGSFTVKIYALTGTYGSSAVPTGSVLATSDTVNVSSLSGTYGSYTINFSGANQITMTAGQRYAFAIDYTNTTWPNALLTHVKTPSFYGGNAVYYSAGWNSLSGYDTVFDIQGDLITSNVNASILCSII